MAPHRAGATGPVADDWCDRRGPLIGLLACSLAVSLGIYASSVTLPQIQREFASMANVALLVQVLAAIASFAFALAAPLAGVAISRFGSRAVILPSLGVFALFGTLPAVLHDLTLIIICRAITGAVTATIFTGGLAGIGQLPEARRPAALGYLTFVSGAGVLVMFPLAGWIAQTGWRPVFAMSLAILLLLPLVLLIPREIGRSEGTASHDAGSRSDSRSGPRSDPRLWTLAFVGVIATTALLGMSMFLPAFYSAIYLHWIGITDPVQIAIPITASSITVALCGAFYGKVQARLGTGLLMAISFVGLALCFIGTGSVRTLGPFTVLAMTAAALYGFVSPNVNAAAIAVSAPQHRARALGLVTGAKNGAQILFPFLFAGIKPWVGMAGIYFVFAVAMGLTGALWLRRPSRAAPSPVAEPRRPEPAQ